MQQISKYNQTSARQDIEISNNVTWQDAFQFGDPDDTTWDLEGQGFELDVQRNPYDAVPLLSMTTSNGRIIVDDTVQRVIHFNVGASDLQESLTPGTYVYDLVMVEGGAPPEFAIRVPLMHGLLVVGQGVTYPDLG